MSKTKNLKRSNFDQSFFLIAECALQQNWLSNHWATGIQARWNGSSLLAPNISMLSKSEPAYPHSTLMHEPKYMRKKDIKPETISKVQHVTRLDSGDNTDGRITCLVALSSTLAKWANLSGGIVAKWRGWYPETDPNFLQHQMALCQSQIRFLATCHRDCHFREESLEKRLFSLPRGMLEPHKPQVIQSTWKTWKTRGFLAGARARRARQRGSHLAIGLGEN
jgi:hypothetical protein